MKISPASRRSLVPVLLLLLLVGCATSRRAIDPAAPSVERVDYADPQRYLVLHDSLGNAARIREVAEELQRPAPAATLRAIDRWIHDHLKNDENQAYRWRNFDDVMRSGTYGSCADYAIVFASLARACGIPAVFVKTMDSDWIYEFRTTGNCTSWRGHVFLEVYLDGRWQLLEPQGLRLFDLYDPRMRHLPGARYAYDKGADPKAMILSLDWERWKAQTASYFRAFDVSRLSVPGRGRALGTVYVAADSPIWELLTKRLQNIGYDSVISFNQQFDSKLAQAKGAHLVVTCVGQRVLLPPERLNEFLPIPYDQIASRLRDAPAGVARRVLDDGTSVTLLYGRDLAAVVSLVPTFEVEPDKIEPGK